MNAPRTMIDGEGRAVKLLNRHPLMKRMRPGPRKTDDIPDPLASAAQILDFVGSGKMSAKPPETTKVYERPKKNGQLSLEEERDLAYRYHTFGDIAARDRLIGSISKLTKAVVAKEAAKNKRYRRDDLEQEAFLGVLRAAQTFEPERGLRFSTYAMEWVDAFVGRFKERQRRFQYAPVEGVGMQIDEDGQKFRLKVQIESSNKPVYQDSEDLELIDLIQSNEASQEELIDQARCQKLVRETMRQALAEYLERINPGIHPRVEAIVRDRILSAEPQTLGQLGIRFGVSRECIRVNEESLMKIFRGKLLRHKEQ